MILNRSKAGQLDRIYKLCNASIDIVSEKIENYLSYIKVEKNTMLRVRLSVEEVLLRWHEVFPEETEFRLTMGSHWNRPFIILKLWGEESDPLSVEGDEAGIWAGELLSAIGLVPTYRYVNGCNIVQVPLKRPHRNPGVTLLLCTLIGAFLGTLLDLAFSADLKLLITSTVLTPLQDAFIRVLNAVSAPVMFLSVLTTVCGVGSISVTGKFGKRMVARFLLYSTLFTVVTLFLCQLFFSVPVGNAAISQGEVSGVLEFFLDVFPGDILSPFIEGDFTQLIVVALVLGNAFLIAGTKVQTLVTLVEEANTAGLVIAEWIGDLSPGFVALLIILGIQDSTIHMLIGIWKPALLITVFSLAALGLRMLHISLRYKVPLRALADKMKDSFLLSLKTFSVETSYTANKTCCEKKLGISRQLTAYGLPIGLICFMPVSTVASTVLTIYAAECYGVQVSLVWMLMALFLAVTLAAAGPPTAGIGILTYTVMFSRLGIPAQGLTLVLAGDILMGFVIYPVNQAMLQLQLVLEADGLGLLKHNILQKNL
ncbi:MAG: cation:dicarboxylase symporter family transporter [Lachnospiraceae bacterium]|nr:cation:dicarboxylase symporter family transporter [Lachnospiraceae bacterium]